MKNINNKELIKKICNNEEKLSEGWKNMTKDLQTYLENDNLDLYKVNEIVPHIFHWPELGIQNMNQLMILEEDKESIFYKTIIKTNNYGPEGIKLYKNIQLDRVQQTWSIYNLVNVLNLNLNNDEIILEFGGGTGQMADVLSDLNFKGRHIVYDLPLITILQRYFVNKRNINYAYILDDEEINIINGTNYLPCNQNNSEQQIMKLPNINFIATFSLTETDIHTHNKFAEYMLNFSRIYIVYSLNQTATEDYINNEEYMQMIKKNIEKTHYCYIGDNYGNGKILIC
jgi:hypothetical protein